MKNALSLAALLMLSFSSVSFAAPFLTSCIHSPSYSTVLCNLYEEVGAYPVTYASLPPFPSGTPGYLVLMDSGDPGDGFPGSSLDQQNLSLWSDVLWFQDNGSGYSTELTLLFRAFEFPTYATVASNNGYFILENHSGPTVWDPNRDGSWLFNIYSPETVPEPSGYAFLLGGFLGLGAVIRWRRRESQSV